MAPKLLFYLGMTTEHPIHRATAHALARRALFSFIVTFAMSRVLVFLIMSKRMPNFFLFVHGTHVHHLNYGIFLLAAVGGYLLFRRPVGRSADIAALGYGLAMGLTFDEFGMWLNLGGSYWQRASVDAVIVVAALMAFVAFARSIERYEKRHKWVFLFLSLALFAFVAALFVAGNQLGGMVGPTLRDLESSSSP
jgi:hypothetical protein